MYMLYFDHLCPLGPPTTLSRFLLPKSPPAFSVAVFTSCWLGCGVTCWSTDHWRKMTSHSQQTPTSDSISVRGGVSLVHLWSMLECWQTHAGCVQVAGCSCWEFRVWPSWCIQKAVFTATPPHPLLRWSLSLHGEELIERSHFYYSYSTVLALWHIGNGSTECFPLQKEVLWPTLNSTNL